MKIFVLGSGCPKCGKLYENTLEAVKILGITADVVKLTDLKELAKYGVLNPPAIVVDGVVKSSGKLLKPKEIIGLLS